MTGSDNVCVIYVDASRDDQIAGLGYTIDGEVSIDGQKYLEGYYTSMEAEFHALAEAVRVASIKSTNRRKCEAYTDCKPVVSKMRYADDEREDWQDYRKSFLWLVGKFDEYELNWCDREYNERAHELAREALTAGRRSKNAHIQ